MNALLSLRDVACAYDEHLVLANVSFDVKPGEIACLLGPSGCGKTTLLRGIAGFVPLHGGEVELNGKRLAGADIQVPPEKREMGMVFQDYALFPHLTVAANIGFGLTGWSGRDRGARVDEMLALVRLTELKDRYPHELSGGQQQRIALARALAPKPKLLLMDEPFSNLDTDLRRQLSLEVRDILKDQGIAAIVVTHDQHEAFVLGDQVGILAKGKLQQWAPPHTLYHQPINPLVASFVGEGVILEADIVAPAHLTTELGDVCLPKALSEQEQASVKVFIRPGDIMLLEETAGEVHATIQSREFLGQQTRYRVVLDSGFLVDIESYSAHTFNEGEQVSVLIKSERAIVFAQPQAQSQVEATSEVASQGEEGEVTLVCRGVKATEPSVEVCLW